MRTLQCHAFAKNARPAHPRPRGFVGWIVLWLMGIPVPVLLGLFLVRGCA